MWGYGVVIYLRSSSFWDVNALYVMILLPTVRDNVPPLSSKLKQSKKND
jgi:hypothetical protein